MKKAIYLDGGIGRVICAIPAVDEYVKQSKDDVVVITGWLEPYLNNKNPKRIYHMGQSYLWEDVIKDSELLHPEPYWDYDYYNQKHHLIQSFYKTLGLDVPTEIPRPNIILQEQEIEWAKTSIEATKKEQKKSKKKTIIFQPYGASARPIDKTTIVDESNRSLSMKLATKIQQELEKDYCVFVMSQFSQTMILQNGQQQPMNMRQWMAMIHEADYVIGIDSCVQHIAYAFEKPGFFIYGGTYPENLSYPEHKIYKKREFPQEYNPIRLPANPMQAIPTYNEGAMRFTQREEEKLISSIKEFIKTDKVETTK